MPNPPRELAELADRVHDSVSDGTVTSERAVQLRAAEPLIEVLGWDVRGDGVRPAVTIDDRSVDYLLTIDAIPAIAVQTAGPEEDLDRTVDEELEPLLASRAVSRGIATDGRRVTLLATNTSGVSDYAFPFSELHEHADALGQFHRSTLEATVADEQTGHRAAAQRLAAESEAVADAIAEELLAITGTDVTETVSNATDEFVHDLVDDLVPDEPKLVDDDSSAASNRSVPSGAANVDDPDSIESGARDDRRGNQSNTGGQDGEGPDAGNQEGGVPNAGDHDGEGPDASNQDGGGPDADDQDGSSYRASDSAGGDLDAGAGTQSPAEDGSDPTGSYVARFFGGSNSVGAVGTASPRSTTVGVVRYLLENQDLHRAVTFPWEVEPGEPVVTDSRPAPDWIALENPAVTDVFVRPIDDPRAARAAIEALADTVDLRVMFQGDW